MAYNRTCVASARMEMYMLGKDGVGGNVICMLCQYMSPFSVCVFMFVCMSDACACVCVIVCMYM